jgi:AraC family cel operon transcriptional repressor
LGVAGQIERLHLSAGHVSRTFKLFVGQTPTAYVNERRLSRAAQMLSDTQEMIPDVALECGFENLSYFYRCFGQHFGCTPAQYRQSARRLIAP